MVFHLTQAVADRQPAGACLRQDYDDGADMDALFSFAFFRTKLTSGVLVATTKI